MVDDLKEAPVLACISYLRNMVESIGGGEINEGDAFSFDNSELRPMLGVLDAGWIDLSHGCGSGENLELRNGGYALLVLAAREDGEWGLGHLAGGFCSVVGLV